MEKLVMDLGCEAQLQHLAAMIMERVPSLKECTIDQVKEIIKYRVNEIMNNH